MKKIIKGILIGACVVILLGSINSQLIKDVYSNIWQFFSPENVEEIIDSGCETSEQVAETIKKSNLINKIIDAVLNFGNKQNSEDEVPDEESDAM